MQKILMTKTLRAPSIRDSSLGISHSLVALACLAALPLRLLAAPLPATLLVDQAIFTNDVSTGHGYGQSVALQGNTAVVGVEGGDPFASVHVFQRNGESWRRLGRLSDSRAQIFDGYGYSVSLDADTLAVGDIEQNSFTGAAYVYVNNGGPGLNAWNILDATGTAVGPSYQVSLVATQHAALLTNSWRLRVNARLVHDLEGSVCMYFSYGNTTNRFLFFLDFTPAGDLYAQLPGASPTDYVLTSQGRGADDYHLHELEFNPATRMATYRFNGTAIKNWAGQAITGAAGVRWGAGSTAGTGSINVRQVRFETTADGAVLANYDAATVANPPAGLNPLAQNWAPLIAAGSPNTAAGPLIPDAATVWVEQARLTAAGGAASDQLGYSIDIAGDTMVVGAPRRAGGGAAYVFVRQGTNWTQQARLLPAPPVAAAQFGASVAINGDTILVGAPTGGASPPPGNAYAFVRTGTNWTQQARIAPTDNQQGSGFGFAVDIDGERAVIGAPLAALGAPAGAIYASDRDGGVWTVPARFLPAPPASNEGFGDSVAIEGDTILAGSRSLPASYLFVRQGAVWVQATRRVYTGGPGLHIGGVGIDGETIAVAVPGPAGAPGFTSGALYLQVIDFANTNAVANYANQLLYYPLASGGAFAKEQAAFRYKHLLYGQDGGGIRARFENIASLYGPDERLRATEAEGVLWRGLARNPDSALLGSLLLDICYDRTVAETILSKDTLAVAERARFGPPLAPPAPGGGFIIDNEIPLQRRLLATNRFALQCYFDLLQRHLQVYEPAVTNTRWAATVLGFSSQYTTTSWSAAQALGQPNTYPAYGDIITAWASSSSDGQREFLELGYASPEAINSVSIYETYHPGAVDKVSVRRPSDGSWQEVWSGVAAPAGNTSRIFTVTFPLTSYPVDTIRIDINSPVVSSWNEIDAVSITRATPEISYLDASFGYRLFQQLVPSRGLMAATYTNSMGANIPVTSNPMLFSGYKDLVLLFDLLRDYGRTAATFGRLLLARGSPADLNEASALVGDSQRFLWLQGNLLKSVFPALPPENDPSALAQAIEGWSQSLDQLDHLKQSIVGDANLLGFAPDFLMLIENFDEIGSPQSFDSFDSFARRLAPGRATSPLQVALEGLVNARTTYSDYRGYEDQVAEQMDNSSITYQDRLRDIVGVFPADPRYSDNPTNNPGSELDQQFRSIEVAHLRIQKNRTEMDNLNQEVLIEQQRAGSVSSIIIRYGNMQASLTETIGHINAGQAAANGLADTFSPDKLLTRGVVVGLLNTVAQAAAEEAKGQLEAQKERLAAMEQAQITGIDSAARVKTLLLGMNTLVLDSQEAALLLQQELGRMAALYREKRDLEAKVAEADASLASRHFADPIHRISAETGLVTANLTFHEAQKWLFFMTRALLYKWNTPFEGYAYLGRTWSADSVFKARNAEELRDLYLAMLDFNMSINRGRQPETSWFSIREDHFGYREGVDGMGQPLLYLDPATGERVPALEAFRRRLRQSLRQLANAEEIVLEFSTAREVAGENFFLGPTFDLNGTIVEKGAFLDKIDGLFIRLPGSQGAATVPGTLTYGGTSFIRNFDFGTFDPARPDRLRDEMTSYSTRHWFFHAPSLTWRFTEAFSNPVTLTRSPGPRMETSAEEIVVFKERSVATTGWVLTIRVRTGATQFLNIDDLTDVELLFKHSAISRQ